MGVSVLAFLRMLNSVCTCIETGRFELFGGTVDHAS